MRFYLVPCFCSCESLYSVCFVLHLFMLNAFFKCVVILGCHFRLRVRHQKADWIVCAEVGGISQGWVLYGKVIDWAGTHLLCWGIPQSQHLLNFSVAAFGFSRKESSKLRFGDGGGGFSILGVRWMSRLGSGPSRCRLLLRVSVLC